MKHVYLLITMVSLLPWIAGCSHSQEVKQAPNIVFIMADDLGFSGLGCYGSEVPTPNLDALAANGIRFTNFHNCARCNPSRGALLTGLYAHQSGFAYGAGQFVNSVTLAQVLREAGYRTLMTGKHHGSQNPRDFGFDRNWGLKSGSCNYFNPGLDRPGEPPTAHKGIRAWHIEDSIVKPYTPPERDFYTTDYFTKHAVQYLEEYKDEEKPFFLYVAYTAPHEPLHAWPEDIALFEGKYDTGYEVIREARYKKQIEMGLLDPEIYKLSPKPVHIKGDPRDYKEYMKWVDQPAEQKKTEAKKMEIYAAMIHNMDRNIGKIIQKVKDMGEFDNTIFMFCSDNGATPASHSVYSEEKDWTGPMGSGNSYHMFSVNWANVDDTPFRYYKVFPFNGGVRTPLIIHWPEGIGTESRICRETGHFIDIMPTLLEISGAAYPEILDGEKILPLEGISLIPALEGHKLERGKPLFQQYEKGSSILDVNWKLLRYRSDWELFDLSVDGSEINDVSEQYPEKVEEMSKTYDEWFERVNRELLETNGYYLKDGKYPFKNPK